MKTTHRVSGTLITTVLRSRHLRSVALRLPAATAHTAQAARAR
ncbi:hypothetical protein [Nonomuraea rubra]